MTTSTSTASDISLTGRKVLVTGGARGLGEAFARALLGAGAQVVISDVLHERGQALAKELGSGAHYLPMDLSDPAAIAAGVNAAAAHMGGLDGLVNNGAITNSGGKVMGDIATDMWDRVMSVNVRGTWLATVAAQPHLAAGGSGRVVNLASDTALWGAPNLMAYVASKGAVMAMTRSMARELGKDGITVNAILPGATFTEIERKTVTPEQKVKIVASQCIPRPSVPQDLVGAALFLASEASGFVTGQSLNLDGGVTGS